MKRLPLLIILAAAVLFSLSSCDNESVGNDNSFQISYTVNGIPLVYGQTYLDNNGRNFQIDHIQFYASGFMFADGASGQSYPDEYMVVHNGQSTYDLPKLPTGTYTGFSFRVGLDSAANYGDPTSWPSSHPLSSTSPYFEHWSWATGYRFIVIEGLVDTSAAGTGTPTQLLEIHVGSAMGTDFNRTVTMTTPIDNTGDAAVSHTMSIDLLDVFGTMDLSPESNRVTHTMDNMPLAMTIANNFFSAVTLE